MSTGDSSVLIGFQPAARVGDTLDCPAAPDAIVEGSPTVFIGFKMAARLGDPTAHGGTVAVGCDSVLIGIPGQGAALQAAARDGVPFCEICDRKQRAEQAKRAEEAQRAERGEDGGA